MWRFCFLETTGLVGLENVVVVVASKGVIALGGHWHAEEEEAAVEREEVVVVVMMRYSCRKWMLEGLVGFGILKDRLASGDGGVVMLQFREAP